MMKSRLHKLEGLTYDDLKKNIDKVVKEIPKEKYENVITPFLISNAHFEMRFINNPS